MTSLLRSFAAPKEGVTRFLKPDSPAYYESDIDADRLFPFSYSNGTLDISYAGNNFKTTMVDISGVSPSGETNPAYRIIGGPKLVTALGDNFKAYIRSWRASTIDSGSPIELDQPAQIVRVQEGEDANVTALSGSSWRISETKPSSDNYITGTDTNKYRTTYIFKTPLTFTIKESGVTKYITFNTIMDQE